jgi:hypothetical protein
MAQYTPTLSQNNGVGCLTSDDNASISIGPGGVFIETGLLVGPNYVASLSYDGLQTTNPDGLQFGSKVDMNNNPIVSGDPITGGNYEITSEQILMVDGSDPQVTQCSIRGSRIAFVQTQFPNRTLTLDPDSTVYTNGGFQTNIVGGGVTVTSGVGNATLGGASLTVNQTSTGGVNDPVITLVNQNIATGNSGAATMHFFKQGNLASSADILGSQIYYGRDRFTGAKTEFARIETMVENSTPSGNNDGTVQIYTTVNGTPQQVFNFNGGQNENNSFRPLDLNGNNLRTASGNLTIDTTTSSGPGILTLSSLQSVNINAGGGSNISLNTVSGGDIVLSPSPTGSVIFTGAALQSATSSGNSGQHLVITLNGVQYKIALQNN